jgi:ribosomal protein S25
MAGSKQKKELERNANRPARLAPRLDAGASRVSSAAGSVGSQSVQEARVEQRGNAPASRQGGNRRRSGAKQSQRSAPAKRGGGKSSSARRPAPSQTTASPRDTQFITWAQAQWRALEAHQQQQVVGGLFLLLSLLLFASLTAFRSVPVLFEVNKFLLTFFGWSAYPLSLGLVALALAHLVEGVRNQRFIRWSMILGLALIFLLVLAESRLLLGPSGVLAELLILPLMGWGIATGHVVLLGLLLITIIVTFRLTFGHVLLVAQVLRGMNPNGQKSFTGLPSSPYLGQKPRFSRYVGGLPSSSGEPTQSASTNRRSRYAAAPQELEDAGELDEDGDDAAIDFEADFDHDDPLNDINVHKQQVGLVPKGAREPRSLDPKEHAEAVRGVSQQSLPFDKGSASRVVLRQPGGMEPLPPNPHLVAQQKAPRAQSLPNIVSPWKVPDTTLLNSPENVKLQLLGDDTASLARTIQETLRSFRVDAEVRQEDISIGPTVIRFGIRPTGKPEMKKDDKTGKMIPVRDAAGNIIYEVRTRVSRIMALQNDLALVLEAKAIRMEAPVPGRPYVGVEIPNKNSRLVTLREILETKEYQAAKAKSKLAMALGRDVAGLVRVGDLARMPHLLIAGATGAGKSVAINVIIASLLTQATPDDVRLLMVDPKMVELSMYNGIPHLLSPVVTEVDKVVPLLKNAIGEMERRYRLFSQLGVRNLDGYRKMRLEKIAKGDTSLNNLPAIVIIIDELADLMMAAPEEVEGMICRLAQLARATGIHLVIATQRPSVDVITGLIKANIPTRISFMVSSAVDSRTIIDMGGAERLLGRGDMLYLPADAGRPERIQCAFLADEEAQGLVDYWRQQVLEMHHAASSNDSVLAPTLQEVEPGWEVKEEPSDEFELDDDLLEKAEEVVREYGRASISLLQRRLRIGYSRAARLIDLLEEHGIIGQFERGGRAREIIDSDSGYDRYHRDDADGHSLASEADEIIAEERARDEFLRKQATSNRVAQPGQLPPNGSSR